MQISVVRSGGFAGLRRVTTKQVDRTQAEQVNLWLEQASFWQLPQQVLSAATQPDRFQYQLTVDTQQQHHTVLFSETTLSPSLRNLLDWLQTQAP